MEWSELKEGMKITTLPKVREGRLEVYGGCCGSKSFLFKGKDGLQVWGVRSGGAWVIVSVKNPEGGAKHEG